MFKRATIAKFEWANPPDDLTELDIESIILRSNGNFAVTFDGDRHDNEGEFWREYSTLQFTKKYGVPTKITQTFWRGGTRISSAFCLFRRIINFATEPTPILSYMRWYSELIKKINHALTQHVTASELIAKISTSSSEEKRELENLFKGYEGIKITQRKGSIRDNITGGVEFTEFEITPRLAELEQLKRDLENDCFLRCGVDNGLDKTHITNANLKDSEQAVDLINSYELKLREDFAERYNVFARRPPNKLLMPTIHTISRKNSIRSDSDSDAQELTQSEESSNDNE